MRPILIAGLLLLFALPAAAHGDGDGHGVSAAAANVSISSLLDHPDELAATYNNNTAAVPGIILSLVADERVNINIDSPDGTVTIGAVMDGTRISELQPGGVANATVTFNTTRATIEEIAVAENPPRAAVAALNRGDIRYEVSGLWNSVMYGVIGTLLRLFGGII